MSMTLFEIGKSALLASRRSMDVTGHNIANSATPGYTRQEALLEPIVQRMSEVSGMGVRVSQVRRLRDFFTDSVLRNETANKASFAIQKDVIEQLQVMAAETSESGLRAAFESFSESWQELSMDPDSQPARTALAEQGRSLIDTFRHLYGQVESLQKDLAANINSNVARVNDLSARVAALNGEIARASARKDATADLLDQRDLLLDELSQLAGASVTKYNDGTEAVRVTVNGYPLVDRVTSYKLSVNLAHPVQYNWVDTAGGESPLTVGGHLGGLAMSTDQIVGGFKQELEDLLKSVVDTVNTQYALGGVVNDPPTDPPLDPDPPAFFVVGDPNNYLATAKVADEIIADPSRIAVWDRDMSQPGNGLNALAISDLLAETPIQTWTGIIGRMGSEAQRIATGFDTQTLLVKEIQNRKDAISGVSIDEEVATLVREQHAFNAASRLITTADELLDTVINRMGAGR